MTGEVDEKYLGDGKIEVDEILDDLDSQSASDEHLEEVAF